MNRETLENSAADLFQKRKIDKISHIIKNKFKADFIAHAFYLQDKYGSAEAEEMFDTLMDNSKLIPASTFDSNMRTNLLDLVPQALSTNKLFLELLKRLVNVKAKGVGAGEMILPLLVEQCTKVGVSDLLMKNQLKELKDGKGASLKAIPGGTTERGHIDALNKKYFNGTWPGNPRTHLNHALIIGDNMDLVNKYFDELWPSLDHTALVLELFENYASVDHYKCTLGKYVLGYYQNIDKWSSLILIDPDTLDIVNIANADKEFLNLNVTFTPVMKRAGDTQAVPDGWVNIRIKKQKKFNAKQTRATTKGSLSWD